MHMRFGGKGSDTGMAYLQGDDDDISSWLKKKKNKQVKPASAQKRQPERHMVFSMGSRTSEAEDHDFGQKPRVTRLRDAAAEGA